MYTISNYKFAESCLIQLSKKLNIKYYNLQVVFQKQVEVGLNEKYQINVGVSGTVNSIVYNIIYSYINDIDKISQVPIKLDKKNLYLFFSNLLRTFSFENNSNTQKVQKIQYQTSLYNFYPVWILLSNIISVAYDIQIFDADVKVKNSIFCDYSSSNDGHIYVNSGVIYQPVRDAFLLNSSLQAFGHNPKQILSLLMNSKYRQNVQCIAKLAYKEQTYKDFMLILDLLSGSFNKNIIPKSIIKTSSIKQSASSFWYAGLLQSMLQPSRGDDWTTYKLLQPFHKKTWDNIQKKRKEKGKDGLSYQALLRIENGEVQPEDLKVMEKMLSSHRIW